MCVCIGTLESVCGAPRVCGGGDVHSVQARQHSVGTFRSPVAVFCGLQSLIYHGLLPAAGHDCSGTRCLRCSLLMYIRRDILSRASLFFSPYIIECAVFGVDGQSRLPSYTTVRVSNAKDLYAELIDTLQTAPYLGYCRPPF